ncbi:WXG100 family type VII secretion target [Prauserella flavalba]|uniref:ESX-1 secretion-associated protein EspA/EspE-like domain-containing protein n=1 Tax=Prauserella flavalba TaxID=1477506 RepID=A0A318M1C5_9PSEU|nr:hypothetical protein [Prauserella flavalba]PXY36345.1 hypothetical protein BA062_13105 [Prauserella flavalba]
MNATTTHPRHRSEEGTEGSPEEPSAVEISTALADLRLAGDSVNSKEWLSVEIAGEPVVSLGMLGSTASPLSALASAGCDFLTPMISFLEEPLGQLRGEPDSVSGPAGEHDGAAQGASSVAEDYGSTVDKETSEWSGDAKTNYTETATKLVDGITSIAEAAATNSKAMIAAGEVVAQVVDIVTRLITEAVGKIVPIMTEAIAAAPATFGASIAQAIPQCVAIAVDYGGQIAAKLGALLASGENLVKLIEGAVGVLNVVKEGLTVIGELAGGGDSSGASSTGTETPGTDSPAAAESESDSETETEEEPAVENPLDGEWTPTTRA